MKTVFFTFAYDDFRAREVLDSTRGKLEHLGFEVFSPLSLTPGEEWYQTTTDALKRASVVVVFLTPRSNQTLFEAGYAYGLGKKIILVSDLSTTLPFDLRTVPAINARGSPAEIAFEIINGIGRIEASSWPDTASVGDRLREMLVVSAQRPEQFELIGRAAFENAIAEEFRRRGFTVDFPEGSHQQGFDMRLVDTRHRAMLVEVKKLNPNSKVSITSVQQLLSAAYAYQIGASLLICTSDFTPSARAFAQRQSVGLRLWSLPELKRYLDSDSSPFIDNLLNLRTPSPQIPE